MDYLLAGPMANAQEPAADKTILGTKGLWRVRIVWETEELVSAVPEEGKMLLTFDKPVRVDDFGSEIDEQHWSSQREASG